MGYKEIHEKLQIKKSSVSTYSGREQDDVLPGAIQGLNKQSMETKKLTSFIPAAVKRNWHVLCESHLPQN